MVIRFLFVLAILDIAQYNSNSADETAQIEGKCETGVVFPSSSSSYTVINSTSQNLQHLEEASFERRHIPVEDTFTDGSQTGAVEVPLLHALGQRCGQSMRSSALDQVMDLQTSFFVFCGASSCAAWKQTSRHMAFWMLIPDSMAFNGVLLILMHRHHPWTRFLVLYVDG